jgi:hypothetical protein
MLGLLPAEPLQLVYRASQLCKSFAGGLSPAAERNVSIEGVIETVASIQADRVHHRLLALFASRRAIWADSRLRRHSSQYPPFRLYRPHPPRQGLNLAILGMVLTPLRPVLTLGILAPKGQAVPVTRGIGRI